MHRQPPSITRDATLPTLSEAITRRLGQYRSQNLELVATAYLNIIGALIASGLCLGHEWDTCTGAVSTAIAAVALGTSGAAAAKRLPCTAAVGAVPTP